MVFWPLHASLPCFLLSRNLTTHLTTSYVTLADAHRAAPLERYQCSSHLSPAAATRCDSYCDSVAGVHRDGVRDVRLRHGLVGDDCHGLPRASAGDLRLRGAHSAHSGQPATPPRALPQPAERDLCAVRYVRPRQLSKRVQGASWCTTGTWDQSHLRPIHLSPTRRHSLECLRSQIKAFSPTLRGFQPASRQDLRYGASSEQVDSCTYVRVRLSKAPRRSVTHPAWDMDGLGLTKRVGKRTIGFGLGR
jgi:hypothetical protein